MRRFEFILNFQAEDEVDAAYFVEQKCTPLLKEVREARDAYAYVSEEVNDGKRHRVDAGDGSDRK